MVTLMPVKAEFVMVMDSSLGGTPSVWSAAVMLKSLPVPAFLQIRIMCSHFMHNHVINGKGFNYSKHSYAL